MPPADAPLRPAWRSQQAPPTPASEIDVLVGRRIRTRREALGISQGNLGRRLGVTFSQIQKYEKGANRIGAGRLFQVADLLGVPVQYFFEGIGEAVPDCERQASPAEVERLMEAFGRIADSHARKALLSLASSMMDTAEEPATRAAVDRGQAKAASRSRPPAKDEKSLRTELP